MNVRRVLIVKPSSLGDIVHSLPFLHVLRRGFPRAHIAWMVGRANVGLLEGHPDIDELFVFERERWGGLNDFCVSVHELVRFVRELRRCAFDLVVDLQGLFRSGLLSWLSGAARRVGFADARELSRFFYSVRVDVPELDMHAVDRGLLVARKLGLEPDGAATFVVPIGEDDRRFAREYLSAENPGGAPLVVMLPSSRWVTKRWPAEYFATLADRVTTRLGAKTLYLGAPGDVPLVETIRGRMKKEALSLVGETSLKQSAAVIARADAVVANDSGPMHLAVALGRPVVALYGPTSPARTGPYDGSVSVLQTTCECAPCFESECDKPECMRDITVDDVFDALCQLMEKTP